MKDEFNEFDEFDEVDNTNDDFFEQDNYYYDDESSFDNVLDDYDYLDYNYDSVNRNDEDYYDYDYSEESQEDNYNKKTNFRTKIVKLILVLITILLVLWVITLFTKTNNNKVKENDDEVKVIKTTTIDYEEMFLKTKTAALKYYNEERVVDSLDQEKSLKLLESLEYLTIDSNEYNLDQSNVMLIENDDKYSLIITLIYDDESQNRTYEVDNYSYCIDSYLCDEQNILGDTEDNTQEINESTNESQTEATTNQEVKKVNLSSWSLWSNYERASCDTQTITCEENDTNCLKEVKTYERKEKVSTYNKVYSNSRLAFSNNETETINICNKYDYVKINGIYYRTEKNSNFKVLGAIKKDTKSNYYNWRYDGRSSYITPPSDTITTRYVYVEPDYSNCGNTCTNNPKYYYDKYTFTKSLVAISNPATDCTTLSLKVVANYSILKQNINVSREENLYGTVCYKSTRTRKVIE